MMSLLKAALLFLGLVAAVALVAGGVVALTRDGAAPSGTLEDAQAEGTTRGIPPIDAAAPAEVETATFALG
jgi:hypothetical protein